MSLDQDVSSIEAVLNHVGLSLLESQNFQPSQGMRKRSGVATATSRLPDGSLDLGSRLAQGSAADLDVLNKDYRGSRDHGISQDYMNQDEYSAKRKRVDSLSDHEQQMHPLFGKQKPHSRDLMPPPPVPHRQPFVYMARVPEPDLDELLGQTRQMAASQPSGSPSPSDDSHRESNLTRQINDAATGHPPTVPTQITANNHYVPIGQTPRTPAAAGPPRQSGWPSYFPQRYEGEHRGRLNVHQAAATSRRPDQRRPQSLDQDNLQFPMDTFFEDHARAGNARRVGATGGLGLSNNARSSSSSRRQSSQSPANAGAHRQRLGEEPSASPHFPRRAPPGSTSRSRSGNRVPIDIRRIDSNTTIVGSAPPPGPTIFDHNGREVLAPRFPSTREMVQQPSLTGGTAHLHSSAGPRALYRPGNLSIVQDNDNQPNRSTADAAGPQSSATQPDRPRGRLPTADPQASALRRRANR